MRIFLDMDGVIADFVAHLCNVLAVDLPEARVRHWAPGDYSGLERTLIGEGVSERTVRFVLSQKDFWLGIPKTPFADQLVAGLCTEDVTIVSCPHYPSVDNVGNCVNGKQMWLEQHYPHLAPYTIYMEHKYLLAGPDTVLIDDSDHNCDNFSAAGGSAILVPQHWNSMNVLDINQDRYVLAELARVKEYN